MLIYIQYAAFMYLDYEYILFDMTSLPLLSVGQVMGSTDVAL